MLTRVTTKVGIENLDPTYIIAEAGVNHNGNPDLAHQLIDIAHACGANAVKFQTFITEHNVTKNTALAAYQESNLGAVEGGQFAMLKALELTWDTFRELKSHCDQLGIDFISTPDDEPSIDLLAELNVPWIKIASAEMTNLPFLSLVGSKNLPIILSTGMSTLAEVEIAIHTLQQAGTPKLALLHCTSNYPCPAEEVNLRAMCTMHQAFQLPVGYSDHTLGSDVAVAAVALGARMIEKHYTLDKTLEGPDHKASLDPDELRNLIQSIRQMEISLGDGLKRPMPSEHVMRPAMRRSLVAKHPLKAGHPLSSEDVIFKRPGTGISPADLDIAIGQRINCDLESDAVITWDILK